jgi:hypothetical protein
LYYRIGFLGSVEKLGHRVALTAIASLSRSLLPLLSGTNAGTREQEIKVILEILRNITAHYGR